eukprot:m.16736 g.16736  ORF g.16736 m.16736 type:complete len:389 (-) comp5776_c0_seq1:91-1257(-)
MAERNNMPVTSVKVGASLETFQETVLFFEKLGWRTKSVFPADNPRETGLLGHDIHLFVTIDTSTEKQNGPVVLFISPRNKELAKQLPLTAPNGTQLVLSRDDTGLDLPPSAPTFTTQIAANVAKSEHPESWVEGRAGMLYRDLIPGRQGGRYVASHIMIPNGGPVPDYVHYHNIRFQIIYCVSGWVKVVYEGQGDPFIMHPGDLVLQPPMIRHRVLESSDNLGVLEMSSPAEHMTQADFEMGLPSSPDVVASRKDFLWSGQRFHRHVASATDGWETIASEFARSWEKKELGIHTATNGLASVTLFRIADGVGSYGQRSEPFTKGDLKLQFILKGSAHVEVKQPNEQPKRFEVVASDTWVVPPLSVETITLKEEGLTLLEIWVDDRDGS